MSSDPRKRNAAGVGDDKCSSLKRKNPGDLSLTFPGDYFEAEESGGSDDGEIKILSANKKIISLTVKALDTIGSIKVKIQAEENIPFDQQELIFNNTALEDINTLANLHIKKGSTLALFRKSRLFIKISITTPEGKAYSLDVKRSETVRNVKAKIDSIGHVFIFNRIVLEDDATLADYNIANGSAIARICKSVEKMEMFVNTFTGKTVTLFVHPSDTIAHVKSEIERVEGIVFDEQALIFNNMVLEDAGTLFDFHINRGSTLTCMRKSTGSTGFTKIFIRNLTGSSQETITLEAKPSDTIANIKDKIEGKIHISRDEQALIFNETVLHDSDTLVDFHISRESTLSLMRVSRGFIQIFIEMVSGKTITLEVKPSDTIYELKSIIRDKEGVPHSLQRLSCKGKILEERPTLADYHIGNGSLVYLMLISTSAEGDK